jgi:two-component system CheB/CheR fusion protein
VRELVLLHGGEVTAASPGPGQGSTFTVRLPVREPSDFAPLDSPEEQSSLAGLRVLLVEDDIEALEMFGSLLELEGAEVSSASSGDQALSLAEAATFDLIVSDVGMPGMDGYQLIQALRKRPSAAAVPAIALTGYGREQDVEKALSSGFTTHLRKPVDLAELKEAVVRLSVRRTGR